MACAALAHAFFIILPALEHGVMWWLIHVHLHAGLVSKDVLFSDGLVCFNDSSSWVNYGEVSPHGTAF